MYKFDFTSQYDSQRVYWALAVKLLKRDNVSAKFGCLWEPLSCRTP